MIANKPLRRPRESNSRIAANIFGVKHSRMTNIDIKRSLLGLSNLSLDDSVSTQTTGFKVDNRKVSRFLIDSFKIEF